MTTKRFQQNKAILRALNVAADTYPDLRFAQLLAALDVTPRPVVVNGDTYLPDNYYEESRVTLERVLEALERLPVVEG